jgi:hypothetical protein
MGTAERGEGIAVSLRPAFLGDEDDMAERCRRGDAEMRPCVKLGVQDGAKRMILHPRTLPRAVVAAEAT